MKKITIFQDNNAPIIIEDNDDKNLNEYSKELANILESNNVNILNTSSCSVIIRPNKINSIVVVDKNNEEQKQDSIKEIKLTEGKIKNQPKKENKTKPIKPPPAPTSKQDTKNLEQNNESIDIITD